MVIEPSFPGDGVNWVVQVAVPRLPLKVHVVGANEPELPGFIVNATVPVGVGDPLASTTVAVHVDAVFTGVELGTQLTEVVVEWTTLMVWLPELLMWYESPP